MRPINSIHPLPQFVALVCAMSLCWNATAANVGDSVAGAPIIHGHARAVAVDSAGNRYVAGYFDGDRDFNPGAGIAEVVSAGSTDAFVTRFNADGSYGWTQTFGGSGADAAASVAVNGSTVYVVGRVASPDAGIGGAGLFASNGGNDAFVMALNASNGTAQTSFGSGGVVIFGGTLDDEATGLVVVNSTLYVCGYFASNDAKLGGKGNFAASGLVDSFILELDPITGEGNAKFGNSGVQTIGGDQFALALGIAADGKSLFVAGTAQFQNGGIGGKGKVAGLGGFDAFVASLDGSTGAANTKFGTGGIQLIGGSGDESALSVAIFNGTVYAAGGMNSIDMGIGTPGMVKSIGGYDAYVAALDEISGAARGAFGISGIVTFGGSANDAALAVAADADHVFVAGAFRSMNAGLGGPGPFASRGDVDAFLLTLDPNTGFSVTDTATFGGSDGDAVAAMVLFGGKVVLTGDLYSSDAVLPGGAIVSGTDFFGFLLTVDPLTLASNIKYGAGDSDGDGFPDDLEAAMGTDPFSALSTPFNLPPNSLTAMTVSKLSIKLNFATPNPKKDTLTVSGSIPVSAGFNPAGQRYLIYVGGVVQGFGLDAKAKPPKSKTTSFKIAPAKSKSGGAAAAAFSATLKSGNFSDKLSDEGLTGAVDVPKPQPHTVRVIVLTQTQAYSVDVPVDYVAKSGKTGAASGPAKIK